MNVATILKSKGSNVVTVSPDTSVADVASILKEARIGAVLVSSDRVRVNGILSERDIVRTLAEHGSDALDMRASDVMSREITACSPDDSVAQLMAVMTEKRIRHLPVLEDGGLIGIVSIGDVVKWRVQEVEHEAEALREYVVRG